MLSIAGSDPSGGAGIQADLKTFESLGVEGCAVPVALTVQNSRRVLLYQIVSTDLVTEQIEAVLSDADICAVKIGMLGAAVVVHAVAAALRRHPLPFVVLDPVIQSTSGGTLLTDDGVDALRAELLPLVTLVTPNAAEAGVLGGSIAPTTVAESRLAARRLRSLGVPHVVVTGGHVAGDDEVVDVLADATGERELRAPRVSVSRTHGTGCRFSSAVAAFVAHGAPVDEACARAQRYVGDWLSTTQ